MFGSTQKYDSVEFALTTGSSDYNLATQQAGSFNNVKVPQRILFRTNITVSVKLDSASNDAITIAPEDSPFEIDWQECTNLFITNSSGDTASIKIILIN